MKVDILAIGAHPDDIELSCSGTLLMHARQGYTFGLLDLTRGELGTRGSADLRDEEAAASAKILGAAFRQNLRQADGFFVNDEIHRRQIIEVIRWCKPQIVLANALDDRHPDHGRAAKLIADACFYSGLRRIETVRDGVAQDAHRPQQLWHYIQDYQRPPDIVVDISEVFETKLQSIKAFKSQFHDPESKDPQTPLSGEDYFNFLEARSREYGRPAGYTFAEGFQRSRVTGVSNLFSLR